MSYQEEGVVRMNFLNEKDRRYYERKKARSAVFVSRANLDSFEGYHEYIRTEHFLDCLSNLLELNIKDEFLVDSVKQNIRLILADAGKENTLYNNRNLLSCRRLINSPSEKSSINTFYLVESLRRSSNKGLTIIDFLKSYDTAKWEYIKYFINESIGHDYMVLQSLLYHNKDYFYMKDTLGFRGNTYFIDALNAFMVENKDIYKYFDFKERAIVVLQDNIERASHYGWVDYDCALRSKSTLKKIHKL